MTAPTLKADLHLHSDHSGLKQLKFLRMRDCYSPPLAVYDRAKARGMDLVTLTDHDTIDGCLEIRDKRGDPDDFFMSEEVETFLPGRRTMHIGVFGITEGQHREIQRRRQEFSALVEYLQAERIPSALNHLFRGYRSGLDVEAYLAPLVNRFALYETRNGTQSPAYRQWTERAIAMFREPRDAKSLPGVVAGSDAHTLRRVGRTWTECPGTDRESFLANLAAGRGAAMGQDGRLGPLAGDVYAVIGSYYASLFGFGRVGFAPGEKWPGVLFCLATAPSHLFALPFLATAWNRLRKDATLREIGAAIRALETTKACAPAIPDEAAAELQLSSENP